jgi:oligogalacturonide lyase
MDLKTGESGKLTSAGALDTSALTLSGDERSIHYFDGPSLFSSLISTRKPVEFYRAPQGAKLSGLDTGSDGAIYFLEHTAGKSRVMKVARPKTLPIAELGTSAEDLMARPRRPQVLYRSAGSLWLMNGDGAANRKLPLASGMLGDANWTLSGRTLVYLHIPDSPKELVTLREFSPEDNTDKLIAKTSQFERVSANGDASVFAGASRSKAQAFVLLLLRATRRELTLCEHRASDPSMVAPIFAPDSQSVFFVTDRHGKTAIYRMQVDKFVSETA